MIDTSILLLHAFHMPHILGIFPIVAGALAGWGVGAAITGSAALTVAATGALSGAGIGALTGASVGSQVMAGQKAADAHRKAAQATNDAAERQYHYDMAAW